MTLTDSQDIVLHDPSFDGTAPYLYDLLVNCGETTVSVAIYRATEKLFVALEHFEKQQDETSEEFYHAVLSRSALLNTTGFRKTVFASSFRTSTLVPNPLYTPGAAETHLQFGGNTREPSFILTDELRQVDARNVHAVPTWLHRIITEKFQGALTVHSSSATIDHLTTLFKNTSEEMMCVDVQQGSISMFVTRGSKLLLHNSFSYENAEGLVYFILFTCEQLQLNPESVSLRFSGISSEDDPAYKLAHKYVRNTGLLVNPGYYNCAPELETLPSHRFFILFTLVSCVS